MVLGEVGPGEAGTLISPLMMSCIEVSKASTLVDIWFIRSRIWVDASSNLASNCSKSVSTKAVSSCGLEISLAAMVPCFEGPCFATGVLSLSNSLDLEGVTGTFNGEGNFTIALFGLMQIHDCGPDVRIGFVLTD